MVDKHRKVIYYIGNPLRDKIEVRESLFNLAHFLSYPSEPFLPPNLPPGHEDIKGFFKKNLLFVARLFSQGFQDGFLKIGIHFSAVLFRFLQVKQGLVVPPAHVV